MLKTELKYLSKLWKSILYNSDDGLQGCIVTFFHVYLKSVIHTGFRLFSAKENEVIRQDQTWKT